MNKKYKHYYKGKPLKIYCQENGINYVNLLAYINNHKDLSLEQIMQEYKPTLNQGTKFSYKSVSLKRYCKENNLPYNTIYVYITRTLKKNPNVNIDKVIDEGINKVYKRSATYFYKGKPLIEYVRENNLSQSGIYRLIKTKMKKNPSRDLNEIIEEVINEYKNYSIKYTYKGESLLQFCKREGIDYTNIVRRVLAEGKLLDEEQKQEFINQLVEYKLANKVNRYKIKYKNEYITLRSYCAMRGYTYDLVCNRVRKIRKNNPDITLDNAVLLAVKEYEVSKKQNEINQTLKDVDKEKIKASEIVKKLKINKDNLKELSTKFELKQAIKLIWYFFDNSNKKDKQISPARLKEIEQLSQNNLRKASNYELYALYKCGMVDTREKLIARYKETINYWMDSISKAKRLKLTTNKLKEEINSEVNLELLDFFNNSSINDLDEFEDRIVKTIRGPILGNVLFYKGGKSVTSLNDIDEDGNELIESVIYLGKEKFSDKLQASFASLSENEVKFINLIYLKNYSYEELAKLYKVSVNDIKSMERKILFKLSKDPNLNNKRK